MTDDPLRGLSPYWRRRIMSRVRTRLKRCDEFAESVRYGDEDGGAKLMRNYAAEVRDEFIRDKGLRWPVEET